MQTIKGTIKFTKKDGRGFQLKEDSNWYSMYRGTLPVKVSAGDVVEVSFEMNGEYRNIKALKVISSDTSKSSKSSGYGQTPAQTILNGVFALSCKFVEMQTELRKISKDLPEADLPAFMQLMAKEATKAYKEIEQGLAEPQVPTNTEASSEISTAEQYNDY
jgi:hypothetical protein